MADEKRDVVAEAIAKLGFDPTKKGAFAASTVMTALEQVKAEQEAKKLAEAVKVVEELVSLAEESEKIDREYKKNKSQVDSKINAIMKKLEGKAEEVPPPS